MLVEIKIDNGRVVTMLVHSIKSNEAETNYKINEPCNGKT